MRACAALQRSNAPRKLLPDGSPGVGPVPVNRCPPLPRRGLFAHVVPQEVQVCQPRDHVKLPVELGRGPVVGIGDAGVALEPANAVLHQHPGGVDPAVVPPLLPRQGGFLVFLYGIIGTVPGRWVAIPW